MLSPDLPWILLMLLNRYRLETWGALVSWYSRWCRHCHQRIHVAELWTQWSCSVELCDAPCLCSKVLRPRYGIQLSLPFILVLFWRIIDDNAPTEGEYIRKWIPELAKLPREYIHCPWEAPHTMLARSNIVLGRNYPKRCVVSLLACTSNSMSCLR